MYEQAPPPQTPQAAGDGSAKRAARTCPRGVVRRPNTSTTPMAEGAEEAEATAAADAASTAAARACIHTQTDNMRTMRCMAGKDCARTSSRRQMSSQTCSAKQKKQGAYRGKSQMSCREDQELVTTTSPWPCVPSASTQHARQSTQVRTHTVEPSSTLGPMCKTHNPLCASTDSRCFCEAYRLNTAAPIPCPYTPTHHHLLAVVGDCRHHVLHSLLAHLARRAAQTTVHHKAKSTRPIRQQQLP